MHFSHCHAGEGQTETTAKELASFTPLLSRFCQQNARRVRRTRPSSAFPWQEHADSKAWPRCPSRRFSRDQDAGSALSFPAATPAAHRSLGAADAAAVEELHQNARESHVTAAQPGPAAMERILLRQAFPSGRDAGSIPCLHGKWAMPSPGAKLELALSWFKKSPKTNLAILMERGVGFSVTLPSAGATHAELVRQARPEVLMKL